LDGNINCEIRITESLTVLYISSISLNLPQTDWNSKQNHCVPENPTISDQKKTNHPDHSKYNGMISEYEVFTMREKKRGLSEQSQIALFEIV